MPCEQIRDPTERLACKILSQLMPNWDVKLHDRQQAASLPDLKFSSKLSGEVLGYIEVTQAIAQEQMATHEALKSHQPFEAPQLSSSWELTLSSQASIKLISQSEEKIVTLLQQLSSIGIDEFHFGRSGQRDASAAQVLYEEYKIDHGNKASYLGLPSRVRLLPPITGGFFALDFANQAIEDELAKPDNRRKLSGDGERHFFVLIDHVTKGGAHAAMESLADHEKCLPPPPQRPKRNGARCDLGVDSYHPP